MIRPYRAGDRDAVYDIAVRTGAAGQDARGRFSTDDLIGDIYAGAYLYLEPEHAYVLDNGTRAVGYVIGTADTAGFVTAYRERWLPLMRRRYQPPADRPATDEEHKLAALFNPEIMLMDELESHPAHLHINLLPDYQGSGFGRKMVDTFLASVAAAGVTSCYLAVRPANTSALGFYTRLGWQRLSCGTDDAILMAKSTSGQ
ncbi:MAG TPA: GNAT family N-acetyltransferase [Streptosporangiaceae bacterium]|nr:GNAT family N-acetyltransferase [Streptosporangiaceae bacterium]